MEKVALGEKAGEGAGGDESGQAPALEVFHSMCVGVWEAEMEWGYFCTTFDAATQVQSPH